MRRSVGLCDISRIYRVKKFQNPTVHAYRSYRKESAYAVSEEKDLQKRSKKLLHHEKKKKRGADGDWESTSVPSRQAGDRESRSSDPSLRGVTKEKNTDVYFTETVHFFP